MTLDKFIDRMSEEVAEAARKAGKQDIYDYHEELAYEKLNKTRRKAGLKPLSRQAIQRAYEADKGATV